MIAMVAWSLRQRAMKDRLRGFDEGTLCINCHSRNMTVEGNTARCGDCWHVADLERLQQAVVTDEQIAAVTKPQD